MNLFKKYFLDVIRKKYAKFKGRASRQEFWLFMLFSFIIFFLVGFLSKLFNIDYSIVLDDITLIENGGEIIKTAISINILQAIVGLMLFLPSLAISIRRLHDIGRSGFSYLLIFIPIIGALILLILFLMPSEDYVNQYGYNYNY